MSEESFLAIANKERTGGSALRLLAEVCRVYVAPPEDGAKAARTFDAVAQVVHGPLVPEDLVTTLLALSTTPGISRAPLLASVGETLAGMGVTP